MLKLHELRGVLPALVTPLHRDGAVDEPAISRLVEHVLAGGVHGVLALGSTGEVASLGQAARRSVLAAVVKATDGRVPVICGVAQSRLADATADVIAAAELGAAAVLVAPPYYYPIDQPTVLSFYQTLAKTSPLPILVYNIPQNTKVVVEPATVAALARDGSVAGIKDSSRDFEYFESVCVATRGLPDFVLRLLSIFDRDLKVVTPTLGQRRAFSSAKAQAALGWAPRPAATTVVDCAESLIAKGAV